MKKLIREPLVHFLILGLGLFILYALVSPEERNNRIVIDQYDLNEIITKWNMQWQRDPTPEELKGLLDQYIKDEIFYREALAMNLDHNDEIIRRRLAQKMRFLTQDIATSSDPSDELLQQYLRENQEKYQIEKILSFEHRYFSRDKRADPRQDALNALNGTDEILGDAISIRKEFMNFPLSRLRADLGAKFVQQIDTMETNSVWQGPVESGYGFHLIKILKVIQARPLTLDEARERIINDYQYDRLNSFNDDLFETLLEQYEVVIDIDELKLEQ